MRKKDATLVMARWRASARNIKLKYVREALKKRNYAWLIQVGLLPVEPRFLKLAKFTYLEKDVAPPNLWKQAETLLADRSKLEELDVDNTDIEPTSTPKERLIGIHMDGDTIDTIKAWRTFKANVSEEIVYAEKERAKAVDRELNEAWRALKARQKADGDPSCAK